MKNFRFIKAMSFVVAMVSCASSVSAQTASAALAAVKVQLNGLVDASSAFLSLTDGVRAIVAMNSNIADIEKDPQYLVASNAIAHYILAWSKYTVGSLPAAAPAAAPAAETRGTAVAKIKAALTSTGKVKTVVDAELDNVVNNYAAGLAELKVTYNDKFKPFADSVTTNACTTEISDFIKELAAKFAPVSGAAHVASTKVIFRLG